MPALRMLPGDVLARKYRVERVLGKGGMGIVVAARHLELGQLVAIKQLVAGDDLDKEQRERFLREARAAVQLKSHHVARVLDVGTDDEGAPYMVMEFLEGQDLLGTLKARGSLPIPEAAEYIMQACEAVGEAHAAGIVHRDLKPANLFLTHDVGGAPCIKVLDFGVSKLVGSDIALTHESQMLGSPLYMSPEHMSAPSSVDGRTDVWALGVILYQLVTGKTPFHAQTVQMVSARVIAEPPTPLAMYRQDIPPGFEALIHRCLEKDRNRRCRDVAELAESLAPFAPAHARMYVQRVARVLGKTSPYVVPPAVEITDVPAGSVTEKPTAETLNASSRAGKKGVSTPQFVAMGVGAAAVIGLVAAFTMTSGNVESGTVGNASGTTNAAAGLSAGVVPEKPVPIVAPAPSNGSAPAASASTTAAPTNVRPGQPNATTPVKPVQSKTTKKTKNLYEP